MSDPIRNGIVPPSEGAVNLCIAAPTAHQTHNPVERGLASSDAGGRIVHCVSPDPVPPDEAVVRRILSGDEAAARELFDRYLPRLRGRVRRKLPARVRRKVGESEVVQEAYLTAFLRLAEFEDRGDGSFSRWLAAILKNKIDDELRRYLGTKRRDVRRETSLTSAGGGPRLPSKSPSPSAGAMALEDRQRLARAAEGLSEDHRTILRLVHEEGLRIFEAGTRMGRSGDAARKLYGRAVSRLAQRLEHPGDPVP